MLPYATRAGRWPLAFAVAAVAALGACADDPVSPKTKAPSKPNASVPTGEFVELTVAIDDGGADSGSIRWAAGRIGSAGGAIHFAPALDGATIVLNGSLGPDGPMYVVGPAKGITLSGNNQYRVISGYPDNGGVSLKNVTITKGYDPNYASAVRATSLYLDNSTVEGNSGPGSAIRVRYGFSATNSAISGNVVGASRSSTAKERTSISNSTIAFNAPGPGIGLYGSITSNYSLLVVLNNSILSNNSQNCLSTSGLRYEGTNISSDWSCGAVGIGIGDPLLMPLANNGGPTRTHAIPHTSPAYNTGVGCFPTTDQRYVPRDAKCDVGAFEFNDFTKVTLTIDATTKVTPPASAAHGDAQVRATTHSAWRSSSIRIRRWGRKSTCTRPATFRSMHHYRTAVDRNDGVDGRSGVQVAAVKATAYTFQTPEWVTPASVASGEDQEVGLA
jgi:hypothetical protein